MRATDAVAERCGGTKIWLAGVDENTNYEFTVALRLGTPKPQKCENMTGTVQKHYASLVDRRHRSRDLTDIGIPRCYLSKMCVEGILVTVGYGRYRAALPEAA